MEKRESPNTAVCAFLEQRRQYTEQRLAAFRAALLQEIPDSEYADLFGDHTCLYAVGSAGRKELSPRSDLDLFVVRAPRRGILKIDEVRIQTAIVRVQRRLGLPDPSNDAAFLRMHGTDELVERLGGPTDDTENTFTARMLLLLESAPILGDGVYQEVVNAAVAAYWTNLEYHANDYLPFYLLNDIIRYWRNVLLNYENRTARKLRELEKQRSAIPDDEFQLRKRQLDADKWLRSCKVRFTRCLTCYATIAWLLGTASKTNNVTKSAFIQATQSTPIERITRAAILAGEAATSKLDELLRSYTDFLDVIDQDKDALRTHLSQRENRRKLMNEAEAFGDGMFELLKLLGEGQRLYRYVVI